MGVPKFFRYISERYPCLSELVRESQIPEFDNMYLDMNGIIHNCSHPNDSDIHFRISEEQIFKDIFHYIDTLFRMIEPKKLFFMAIDGVAPRAKMNQQRGRRFRSAKEAEVLELHAKCKNEELPTEERFDSNCITPGTAFMARLNEALKHFVKYKITTNPLWQNCRIILSGHETPGEGEHKIMEYIRYLKSQPDFDPNTRHCLYGLDADLIMLGLCTHEAHFSLLREEVKFSKQAKRTTCVDETRFFLLHLGLLKEYLDLEFSPVKNNLNFPYDIENIIDDWILMGFLVGNDFIPNLPNLHIASNALPLLYKTYMEVLTTLDGYINEQGKLNLPRLEVFMQKLAIVDLQLFQDLGADFKSLNADKNMEAFDIDVSTFNDDDIKAGESMMNDGLDEFIKMNEEMMGNSDDDDEDTDAAILDKEFRLHKRNYYVTKMNYSEMTEEVIAEQTECYIRALQWTLSYYYHGVQSWSWYYPHHYAPYISDIQHFKHLKLIFDMGKPFLPFEQLLGVLPAASKKLLPKPYHKLMTDENSEVIEYYPLEFETDLNGKRQEWEAVVLIPFIDEKRLLNAMRPCNLELSDEEKKRNIHGPMLQYEYSSVSQKGLPSKFKFPEMKKLFCEEVEIFRDDLYVPEDKLVLGPSKNATRDVYFPGFPTMKHLKYSFRIAKARVKVFEQASRNDNMLLTILSPNREGVDLEKLGEEFLDREVYVSWPHLSAAKVVRVANSEKSIIFDKNIEEGGEKLKPLIKIINTDSKHYQHQIKMIRQHHMDRLGIDFGETEFLIFVLPIKGQEYSFTQNGEVKIQKLWGKDEIAYPVQAVIKDIKVYNSNKVKHQNIEDIFVPGNTVFMISTIYYGTGGKVIDSTLFKKCGRIKVELLVYTEPDFSEVEEIHRSTKNNYFNSYDAASIIGISNTLFSRITGTVLVIAGMRRTNLPDNINKTNIGLNLKFTRNNEEVVGYTKRSGNQWFYSNDAIELVKSYLDKFPDIFIRLGKKELVSNDVFFETEFFPNNVGEHCVETIMKWLKEQPYQKAERRACGTQNVEKETVEQIIKSVNEAKKNCLKSVKLQVKPFLVYNPLLRLSHSAPDPSTKTKLFDRVLISRNAYIVPLGYRGTVIGIHEVVDQNPVRQEHIRYYEKFYDVLFDLQFDAGNSVFGIAEGRVYRVAHNACINISHGLRKNKPTDYNIQESKVPKDNQWSNRISLADNIKRNNFESKNIDQTQTIQTKPIENLNLNKNNIEASVEKSNNKFHAVWDNLKKDGGTKLPPPMQPKILTKLSEESKAIIAQNTTESIDDGTDALKKLLGLQLGSADDKEEKLLKIDKDNKTGSIIEDSNTLTVDQIFKMHNNPVNKSAGIPNLPKPPSNWTQDTFLNIAPPVPPVVRNQNIQYNNNGRKNNNQMNNGQMVHHNGPPMIPNMQLPPPSNQLLQHTVPPMYQNNLYYVSSSNAFYHRPQAIPCSPEKAQKQIINHDNQNHMKPSCPKGPQNLSNNQAHPAGHGAFIPLQAVRNIQKKQQQQQLQQQNQEQSSNYAVQRNAVNRQAIQQKQEQNNENFKSFMKEETQQQQPKLLTDETTKNIKKVQLKPRTSRIAARFKVNPN